jgi:hypothetical protein
MSNDTAERHAVRSYGRFPRKGVSKRAASKWRRSQARRDIAARKGGF